MTEYGFPGAFLFLIPAFALLGQRWLTGRNVLAVPGFEHTRIGISPRVWLATVIPAPLQLLGLILCIVALARPRVPHRSVEVESVGLDILLAVDTSGSMQAEDFKQGGMAVTRLQVAKGVIAEFIKGRPNDRIGVVVFGEEAFTQVPLTLDHQTLLETLSSIDIGIAGARGTAIGSAIAVSAKRLKDLEAPDRVMILLTDGDNNAGRITPMQAAEATAALDITLYTIGIGRKSVGFSLLGGGSDGPDERTLTEVAEVTGGQYFRATDTRSLEKIYDTIDELEPSPAKVKELVDYEEQYRWWLVPGLACLGASLLLGQTVFRRGP